MMRTLLVSIALVRFAAAQTPAVSKLDISKVDALAEAALKAWNAPGVAVAVVRNDRVLMAKGYGVKERNKPGAVTADTVFANGSMSKAFTTASMAMLIGEGKMSWDDPVRRHVGFFRLCRMAERSTSSVPISRWCRGRKRRGSYYAICRRRCDGRFWT